MLISSLTLGRLERSFHIFIGIIRFLKQERKYRVVFSKLQRVIGLTPLNFNKDFQF